MEDQLELEPKQLEAKKLAQSEARFILFRGGSRSGKSFAICYFILKRALAAPNSRHGIFRSFRVDAERKLFDLTFKKMMEEAYPGLWDALADPKREGSINQTDLTITLPNGAVILFAGLDTDDKVLGDEFTTIFVNEATQVRDYGVIETLISRLSLEVPIEVEGMPSTGRTMVPKLFLDCNPTSNRHWTFKAFAEKDLMGNDRVRVNPKTNEPWEDPQEFAQIKMNPEDNKGNIASTYMKDLNKLSARERRRFLDGEWQAENDNALFNSEWINENRRAKRRSCIEYDDFARIIVAIDPAASANPGSDEHGIIVAGLDYDGHVHILEDRSMKGQPQQCAEEAIQAYVDWGAHAIVVEKNNGGAWITDVFRLINHTIPVRTVHASNGKAIRAEPVSALYEQGKVHHCGTFDVLEGQLEQFTLDWNRNKDGSPDRLDALVWAVTELGVVEPKPNGGMAQVGKGFWR